MDFLTTSEQEECMDAVRNENIDVVTSYVKKGIFQPQPNCFPLIYSCLPLANSKVMLNILIAASPLVLDYRFKKFINENVDKPFLLEFLLDYLKSQKCSLDEKGVDLMSSAIMKRASVDTFKILLDHGVDPCVTLGHETSSLLKVAEIDDPWSINIFKIFCVSNTGSFTFRTQLESVIKAVIETLSESTSINDLKFEKLKILFTAGMSNPNKDWNFKEEAIFLNVYNCPFISPELRIILIRLFLESGEDVNFCDGTGRTLIMLAVESNEEVIINLLLKSRADLSLLDSQQKNVLHYAMSKHSLDHCLIDKLLQHGADPNVLDCLGKTPLMLALEKCARMKSADYNIAETRGADVQNSQHLSNVVDVSSEVIKTLLKHGANPNLVDREGRSPLIIAVQREVKIEIIDILVRSGANLQHQDKQGNSLLHYAVNSYNKQCTSLIVPNLLNHGINLNVVNAEGETPLMFAAKYCEVDIEIVKLFINAGSDFRITDLEGNTAFHFLVKNICFISESFLNFVFETHEDCLTLSNAKNESVFYLLTKSVLKQDENLPDFFVNLCRNCSEENLIEMSKDCQKIVCETFQPSHIQDLLDSQWNYFNILLSSPFKIVNNHVMQGSLELNYLSKDLLISTNVIHCNFITKMCLKLFADCSRYNYDNVYNNFLAFIKKLESYGFDLLPSNSICISPLAAVLSIFQHSSFYSDEPLFKKFVDKVMEVAQYLIEKGADVTESKLQFKDGILTDLHRQFPVPDALWIALLSGRIEPFRLLLPFWPHPPLALLIYILPAITHLVHYQDYLRPVYPILAAGGPLPIGSPIYQRVSQLLEQKQNVVGKIRLHFQSMHHNDGEIRSLLSLSVSATRATFPGGSDLPERLSKPMPPGIRNILQLDLDTTLVQKQLDEIEEPQLLQESGDDEYDSYDDFGMSIHDVFDYDSDTGIFDF